MTTVHWLSGQDPTKLYSTSQLTKDTSAPGERKITTSYLDHRTSTWNDDDDDDVNKGKTFTTSGFVASVSFFDTIRYTGYLTKNGANSSVFQNASSNALSWSTQKISTTGTFSTTPQDTGTLISGATSSGSTNVWPSFSTAIRTSSESKYLKSGESTDFQITIRRSEHSNLGQPGSPTVTTAIVQSPSKTVNLTIRGTANTLSPTTKSSLPSSSSYKQSDSTNFVTSLSRMLPGGTFSHGWLSSESISPVTLDGQYSTMIKENISTRKSSFSDHNKSTRSMSVSPTPAVRFALELVSSSSKVHKTSQSALAKKLISTDSKMVSSKSLRGDFSTVVMTSFPSLSLSNNQGSAVVKFLTPTKPASFAVTQGSNPSTLGARSTNRAFLQTEKQSLVSSTLPWYTRNNGISTARVVTSLRTFPSSRLQRRLSISQSRSEIKATSFGSAAMLNSSSKSSSLSSSPGGLRSLPDAMSSSYGSISSRASYDYLPSFASEATTNGVSSWIATQNISSRSPSSNSKPISTSRKMSTQHWHAGQSTDSLRYLNPNSRVKEFLPANLTIKTTNPAHGHQQTLHKITSVALALSTVTSSLIITTLSLKQPTALSQSLQSITNSLPPVRLTPRRMSSHSKNSRLSNVISSMENLTSNKPLETSQHHAWYTQTGYTLAISTITCFSITTVMSNSRGISAAEPVSKTTISQLDDAGLSSNISSTLSDRSSERLTVMQSSKKGHSVLTMELHKTFQQILVSSSKDTPTNSTATQSFIATTSPSVQSRILLLDGSSASHFTTLASRNKSLYVYNLTHSKFVLPMETVTIFPSPISTSTTQVKPLETTVSYSFSTVLTNYGPTTNSTAQFKIMDGSLVIRNRLFHENLSSPNTTMFKALADEVEEIIMDIVSLDAEVTSFRNGSIVANFYLLVASGSPFSDRDYADMLSQANETLWRGYQVTNITVILRVDSPRATARLHDGGGLSKAAVAAIFTVFSVLLIAVGCFGAYICKKKRLCERSRVKPAE